MTQLRKDLQWGGPVQTFSGARVQSLGNGVQLALRVGRQVRALGQILTEQAIGIFIRPALPRAAWVAKVDIDVCGDGELLTMAQNISAGH